MIIIMKNDYFRIIKKYQFFMIMFSPYFWKQLNRFGCVVENRVQVEDSFQKIKKKLIKNSSRMGY